MSAIKKKVWVLIRLLNWVGPTGLLQIIYYKKKFYIWDGKAWIKHTKDEVYNIIIRTAHDNDDFLDDTKDSTIRDIIKNLAAICYVDTFKKGKSRTTPDELGVFYKSHTNGILRIQVEKNDIAVRLIPFDCDILVTSTRDYPYDPSAQCPHFLHFLGAILPDEEIFCVQEFMGLTLLPINPTQKFFIYFGEGGNGKSSLVLAHQQMLGEDDISYVPLKEFLPNSKFGLVLTEDKNLNIAEELDDYGYLASSALKNYVTQGKIIVQEKHQNLYSIKATAKLLFSTNSIPTFRDHTDGLIRRIEIVPFTRQFLNPVERDERFSEDDYWKNIGELPGILSWAIEGLKRLAQNNWSFTSSPRRKEILENYKQTSNPAAQFLKDNLEACSTRSEFCSEIFRRYERHCKTFNILPETDIHFGRLVRKVFPLAIQTKSSKQDGKNVRSRSWKGIRFKTSDDPETEQIAQITSASNSSADIGGQNE